MKLRKLHLAWVVGLPALLVLLVLGYFMALQVLKQQITTALGQTGEVGDIRISRTHIDIEGLRIKASRAGWPTADELRAERVRVSPDLGSLLSGRVVIGAIAVDNAALTVLRGRGGIKILPALLDRSAKNDKAGSGSGGPAIHIARITLTGSRVDFYDATVTAKALHIPLDQLELSLSDLALPALDKTASLKLQARVAGQGSLSLEGDVVPASLDSDLRLKLAGVPLKLVEPYLFKGKAGEVKAGVLALNLHAKVARRQLHAPGHLTLTQLELGGVTGFTRDALALFARSKGLDADTRRPVDMDFTLQGNLDDSRFSLNDTIYAQGGLAALKLIGLGGGDKPQAGLGDAIKGLFGK